MSIFQFKKNSNIRSGQMLKLTSLSTSPTLVFFGLEVNTKYRCLHGDVPERKVAFDMVWTGRKFLGYPHKGDQRCQFVLWMDKAWNPVLARTLVWLYNLAGSRACCEHPIGEPETNIDIEFLEFL